MSRPTSQLEALDQYYHGCTRVSLSGCQLTATASISTSTRRRAFTLVELTAATNNFAVGNLLREGGLGHVYKGIIESAEIGSCADGDERLLVYEYMPLGSLKKHLFEVKPNQEALDWHTRLRIATGAARGLE
ncbi:hypothetical protein L1887_09965 [Cichorium endivia]|nr:hypothetical protein L1887_09965 [Cichorium endivia]